MSEKGRSRTYGKMNITQIGSYPPPYGGQSIHIQSLKNFMVSQGHECHVYNTGKNKKIKDNSVVNTTSICDLILRLFSNDSELLHVHCGSKGTFPRIYASYILSKILGKKIVLTIHSGEFPKLLKSLNRINRFFFLKILYV